MIKGVIFDADGTILNSMPVWENLGELYLESMGIEAEKDLGGQLFELSLEQGAQYLIDTYHLQLSVPEIMKGIQNKIGEFYKKKVPLKQGVRDFILGFRELKIPMVVATTAERSNIEAALERLNIRRMFDSILTCTEFGTDKKHPDIFLAACLQMDLEPYEMLVFEDAYHAIKTAKKAGFHTVAVYDKANDANLSKIWNEADLYLPEYDNFDLFWRRASRL